MRSPPHKVSVFRVAQQNKRDVPEMINHLFYGWLLRSSLLYHVLFGTFIYTSIRIHRKPLYEQFFVSFCVCKSCDRINIFHSEAEIQLTNSDAANQAAAVKGMPLLKATTSEDAITLTGLRRIQVSRY